MTEAADTARPPTVEPSGITEVAEGVWVIPDRRVPLVPNIGIVLGDDAALVVDTGMGVANGRRVLDAARAKAGERRLLLTVTHFHPEHGFGAQVFKRAATIVYNRAQLDELGTKGDPYVGMFRTFGPDVEHAREGVQLVEADETYSGSHTIDLGGRTVTLREVGAAHTRGDQLVTVDDAGVVFAGDLVEEGCFPIFPYFPPEDADIDGDAWIRVLAELEAQAPVLVVPGHGSPGGANIVATQRRFMEELRDAAHGAADEGRSADEAVAELEPRFHAQHPDWVQPEWVAFAVRYFHDQRAGVRG
jgi:glyoxylase-like metal-dependent hydrolase (beta-lactamase superfamily II)